VAVDQSREMLRAARRRLARLPHVEIHEAHLEALPLPDGSCDAALAVLVLSYLEDPPAALREAARILRPGGRLVVVEAARHTDEVLRRRMGQRVPGFEAGELAALIPDGLTDVTTRAVPPAPGAKGPGLVVATARRRTR
jgi:ArsR family transcriptional regulator